MYDLIPLNQLLAGQSALVDTVVGQTEQVHRLHEMGLRQGAEVQMIQRGQACIVRLGGHKVCFRGDELLSVLVRVEHSTTGATP